MRVAGSNVSKKLRGNMLSTITSMSSLRGKLKLHVKRFQLIHLRSYNTSYNCDEHVHNTPVRPRKKSEKNEGRLKTGKTELN